MTLNLTPNSIPTLQGAMTGAAQGLPTTEDGKYSSASVTLAEDFIDDEGTLQAKAGENVTIDIPVAQQGAVQTQDGQE